MWSRGCIGKTKVSNSIAMLPHLKHHSSQCSGVAEQHQLQFMLSQLWSPQRSSSANYNILVSVTARTVYFFSDTLVPIAN